MISTNKQEFSAFCVLNIYHVIKLYPASLMFQETQIIDIKSTQVTSDSIHFWFLDPVPLGLIIPMNYCFNTVFFNCSRVTVL